MSEQSIVAVNSSVMLYDDCNKKWMHCGTSPGISRVQIYHHTVHNTFRIVGRKIQGHEVVLNCSIPKNMKYNVATPTFHQWRDNRQVYGLNFANLEEAENFSAIIFSALNALAAGVPNPLMTNANAITENGYHNAGSGHYRNQSTGSAPQYAAPCSEVSYNNGHDPTTYQKIEYQQRFYSNPREVNGWCESNKKYASDGAGISENTNVVIPNGPCVPIDNGQQQQYNPNNSALQYNNTLSPNPNSHPGQGGAYNLSPYQTSTLQASAQPPGVVNSQSASPQYPLNYLSPRQENARAPGGTTAVCTSPSYYVETPATVQNANGSSVNGNRIPPPPPLPSFHGDTYNSLGTGIANIKLKKVGSGQTTQVNATPPAPTLPPTSGAPGPVLPPTSTNSQMMQEMMATLARRKARLRAPAPNAASEISQPEALNSNTPPAEISNYNKLSVTTTSMSKQSCSSVVALQNSSSMSSAASSSSFSSIQSADSGAAGFALSQGPGPEPVLNASGHINNGTLTMNGPITNASLSQAAMSSSASNSSPMLKKKNEVKCSTQTGLEMNGWDCLKQELLTEMRKELQTVKQDIINVILAELSKRRC